MKETLGWNGGFKLFKRAFWCNDVRAVLQYKPALQGLHPACVLQVLASLFLAQLHVNIWVGGKLWSNLCLKTGIAVNLVSLSSECLQSWRLLNLSGCSIPKNSPCECCHYSLHPSDFPLLNLWLVLLPCTSAHSVPPAWMAGGCRELLPTLKNTISTAFLHALAPSCASGPCWTPSGFSISLVFQWQNWA